MVSRNGWSLENRQMNTEVRVYSTEDGGTEVASCGKITGNPAILFVLTQTDYKYCEDPLLETIIAIFINCQIWLMI